MRSCAAGRHALVQITAPGEPCSGGYSSPQNGSGISELALRPGAPQFPASAPFVMTASLARPGPVPCQIHRSHRCNARGAGRCGGARAGASRRAAPGNGGEWWPRGQGCADQPVMASAPGRAALVAAPGRLAPVWPLAGMSCEFLLTNLSGHAGSHISMVGDRRIFWLGRGAMCWMGWWFRRRSRSRAAGLSMPGRGAASRRQRVARPRSRSR